MYRGPPIYGAVRMFPQTCVVGGISGWAFFSSHGVLQKRLTVSKTRLHHSMPSEITSIDLLQDQGISSADINKLKASGVSSVAVRLFCLSNCRVAEIVNT